MNVEFLLFARRFLLIFRSFMVLGMLGEM